MMADVYTVAVMSVDVSDKSSSVDSQRHIRDFPDTRAATHMNKAARPSTVIAVFSSVVCILYDK